MLYNLSSPLEAESARTRLTQLIKRGAVAELREKKPRRSLPQNAYLHLLLGFLAAQTGCTLSWVKERYYKRICNPDLFCTSRRDPVTGEQVECLRSSSELSTEQMALSITRLRNWAAAEAGIYLPEAHKTAELAVLQVEVERYKPYLY